MSSNYSVKSISARVAKGSMWMSTLRITDRIFNFARTIVLARLLAPKDFGLFAIALVAIMALTTFSKTGFHGALIQKKEDIKDYLDTAWVVHVIRGAFLATILFVGAPYIASFFNEPSAAPLLRVLALSLLLEGSTNPALAYLERDLNFRKLFVYEISGTIFDIGASVAIAFILRNVWALVYGLLARRVIQLVLSFLMVPGRIRLRLESDKFNKLFSFGKYLFLSSILNFLLVQGSQAFVGKVLGAAMLGFYVLAFRISDLPTREVINIISRVTFPAYSKLQGQILKLQEGYLRIFQVVSFILIPVAVALFVLARDFTKLFLGQKWMTIVPVLQVLVIWGGLRSINVTSYPLFQGVGKPEIETKIRFVQIFLLGVTIYPFSLYWNLLGICLAVLLSELLASPVYIYQIIKITGIRFEKLFIIVLFPVATAFLMAGSILLLKTFRLGYEGLLEFLILVMTGMLTYLGLTYLFDRLFNYGIIRTVSKYLVKAIKT